MFGCRGFHKLTFLCKIFPRIFDNFTEKCIENRKPYYMLQCISASLKFDKYNIFDVGLMPSDFHTNAAIEPCLHYFQNWGQDYETCC